MADTIDLGEFTFNSGEIDKQLETLEKQLFNLRQEQKENAKQARDLQKAMDKLAEANVELARRGEQGGIQFQKNNEEIKDLNKQLFENFKSQQRNRDMINTVAKEYRETSKVINSLVNEEGKRVTSSQAINVAVEREIRSIKQARDSNKELLQIRNELDIAGGKNADLLELLNDKINRNNDFIKANVSEYEKQKIGIGDYTNAIRDAFAQTGIFEGELGSIQTTLQKFSPLFDMLKNNLQNIVSGFNDARKATEGMDKAQKMSIISMQSLTTALKLLRVALISTGIGAIVVALGSLIAYLSTTQEGFDKITAVTRPLTAVFQTLLGLFQDLGKQLFDDPLGSLRKIYDFVKDQMVATFKNLGDIIAGVFTFDFDRVEKGWEAQKKLADDNSNYLKKKFSELGGVISEAWDKGKEIDRLTKEIEKMENDMILFREEENVKLAEQELIMRDTNRSLQEREKALKEHERITQGLIEAEGKLLDTQIKKLEIQQSMNDSSRADEAEMNKLLAERVKLDKTASDNERKNIRVKNQIRKESESKYRENLKATQDQIIKNAEEELALLKSTRGIRKLESDEAIDLAKRTRDAEIQILEEKLKFQRISQKEFEAESIAINNEYLNVLKDHAIETAEFEYQETMRLLKQRQSENEKFTEERLQFEIETSQKIFEAEKALQDRLLAEGEINKRDYENAIFELEEENRERRETAELEFERANKERMAIDLENQRAIEDELFETEFERKQARLQRMYEAELEMAEKTGADINLIHRKYAIFDEQIEREKQEARLGLMEMTSGAMANLLGKESQLGKSLALAQAFINVAQGVTKAIAQGGIAGIATGATVAMAGAKSIMEITKTKIPKAERGGILRGRRHRQGGMLIEAEDGEAIINRRSTAMFPELLSAINIAGGGIPLAERGMVAGSRITNNSIIQNSIQQVDQSSLVEAVETAVERGSMRGSRAGSHEGMVDLSDNRTIQQLSTF